MGRWFGLGESDGGSDTIEDSNIGQPTYAGQRNPEVDQPNFSRVIPTQNSQVATNGGERSAEVEQPVPARPRRILNFIRPRAPSQRILQKKLSKNVSGVGSSSSNALDLA